MNHDLIPSRLFTFGCSFTQYIWPTWADILGFHYSFYENWGRSGAGNQYIFNAIIECDLKYNLKATDLVCIMFTNFCREDRYVQNQWISPGNIFSQSTYDSKFVRQFADIRGYYIRDLATIYAIDKLLTHIGCKKFYFSMVDITNPYQYEHNDISDELDDLIAAYQPVIDKILPSFHKTVFNYDWYSRPDYNFLSWTLLPGVLNYYNIKDPTWPECRSRDQFLKLPKQIQEECREVFNLTEKDFLSTEIKRRKTKERDTHPVPLEHLEYLDQVCPELPISDDTRNLIMKIHELGSSNQEYTDLIDLRILNAVPTRW
jgi:hypothetical protein